jgi:hypothetical protein
MRAFSLTGAAALQVSSWNSLASVRLTIRGYTRDVTDRVTPFEFAHVPASNRTITSTIHPLPEGELLNVTVFLNGAAPITGQTFVRLQLLRGRETSSVVLGTLAAGYVTAVQPLAFPGSGVKSSLAGPGALRSITGTNPAAGVEISETVPTNARWRVYAVRFALVTDATVASRESLLTFDDGATVFAVSMPAGAQAASSTFTHDWFHHTFPRVAAASAELNQPLPRIDLLAAARVRTVTTNLQAGDNYGAPQLLVEEWLEGAA